MKIYLLRKFASQGVMMAYHGTCSSYYEIIKREGLKNPYLARTIDLAEYYAEQISSLENKYYDYGHPVVLEVIVRDTDKLRYDSRSMDEPVMISEDKRDSAWDEVALLHPEWVEDDMISIPISEWEVSWNVVGAVVYDGIIPPEDIRLVS